ncbi:MAG: choice-of-anchor J domain-containing protein [Prevotellaceae bacterium]|nr:choice-of-anchor J domain-containing protein [Prevotellaceae bacterium]
MKQNILWAVALLFAVASPSCDMEKGDPQPPGGLTQLYETFESLSSKNSVSQLSGWTNIMVVDSAYTAPLQWQAYETGCNMVMQASAHKYDDSNRGIRYESWLLTPPLDFNRTANKTLSFRSQAAYWMDSTTLDVFLVKDISAIGAPEKLVPLQANLPTQSTTNKWLTTTLNMSGVKGVAMLGFRYRAVGGASASTSFRIDDVTFGDVSKSPNVPLLAEDFTKSLGGFTVVSKTGAQQWSWNSNTANAPYTHAAKISGFVSGNSNPNEDWLISPSVDLSRVQGATLIFEHSINKGLPSVEVMRQEQTVLVSTNCVDPDKPDNATWESLTIPAYPSGTTWTFACSGRISLSKYTGSSNVRIAFKYVSGKDNAATWSIANFKVTGK